MVEHIRGSAHLKGATIEQSDLGGLSVVGSDLRGATIRESYLDGLRVVGSVLGEVHLSSFAGDPARVVVEGVDVWEFVSRTLDERHPERVQLRSVTSADDHRAMWTTVERLWATLLEEAAGLGDDVRRARVAGEWSLEETTRHLVFAVDSWVGRMLRAEDRPFHPLGLPPTDFPLDRHRDLGLDPDAEPSWDDVVTALRSRHTMVREELGGLTDELLPETRTIAIAPPVWGEETETVAQCFTVLHHEHVEHLRYARRDLAVLTGS